VTICASRRDRQTGRDGACFAGAAIAGGDRWLGRSGRSRSGDGRGSLMARGTTGVVPEKRAWFCHRGAGALAAGRGAAGAGSDTQGWTRMKRSSGALWHHGATACLKTIRRAVQGERSRVAGHFAPPAGCGKLTTSSGGGMGEREMAHHAEPASVSARPTGGGRTIRGDRARRRWGRWKLPSGAGRTANPALAPRPAAGRQGRARKALFPSGQLFF